MRIDVFLKVAGLLKTRSIAGKAISSGAVSIDGIRAKASAMVEPGSEISLIKPDGESITIRVLEVPGTKTVSRKDRKELFEIVRRGETGCF